MAIYHLSVKTFSRSKGQSATAAAAYRASAKIKDKTTGEIFDYTKKSGVIFNQIFAPEDAPDWVFDRENLWNKAEQKETRKNSTVAREIEIALPAEFTKNEREKLTVDFCRELVETYGFALEVSIHEPSREGSEKNHHAHILCTTRRIGENGFNEKTRELDDMKTGEVVKIRQRWAQKINRMGNNLVDFENRRELANVHGEFSNVSHLSNRERDIEKEPTKHLGVARTAIERKNARLKRELTTAEADVANLSKPIEKWKFKGDPNVRMQYDPFSDVPEEELRRIRAEERAKRLNTYPDPPEMQNNAPVSRFRR